MPFIKTTPDAEGSVDRDRDDRRYSRDLAGLAAALNDEDSDTRRWAARDLVEFPKACPELVTRLHVELDPSVRGVLFTTLIYLGSPDAVLGMITCLRSEDASVRNEAIEAMKQLPDVVAPLMNDLLSDSDFTVRLFAVNILVSLAHSDVEQWLITLLDHEMNVNVCAAALDVLVEIGGKNAEASVIAVQSRFPGEAYIQFATELALKRIGGG